MISRVTMGVNDGVPYRVGTGSPIAILPISSKDHIYLRIFR